MVRTNITNIIRNHAAFCQFENKTNIIIIYYSLY